MKKFMIAMLCAALSLTACAAMAEAAVEIEGRIEPAKTLTILAPYSGLTGDFTAEAGDVIAAGETLFTLSTTKLYADFDGTVTGVFAQPGDSAASVAERYGAAMYLERAAIYSAECTTNGSASDNENKIVHVGETVYVQSTADSKRDGVGVVTSVNDKAYTVEIHLIDELKVNDQIKVYRESDHDNDSCIGSGRTARINPVAVAAQGSVLAVHVRNGQQVSRGDLLIETVPDALNAMKGGDGTVKMPQDGVLLSVSAQAGTQAAKDQVLATYCPAGEMKLVCAVDEDDLKDIAVGDMMTVIPDALEDVKITAKVEKIAAAADENGEYAVTLALEDTEDLRIGMSATAEK